MCIRDSLGVMAIKPFLLRFVVGGRYHQNGISAQLLCAFGAVSYTHLRAHETVLELVCRLLLEKKKQQLRLHNLQGLSVHYLVGGVIHYRDNHGTL